MIAKMGQKIQRALPYLLMTGAFIAAFASTLWLTKMFRPRGCNFIVLVNSDGLEVTETLRLLVPTASGHYSEIVLESPNQLGVERGALLVFMFDSAFGDGVSKLLNSRGDVVKEWNFEPPGRYYHSAVLLVDKETRNAVFNRLPGRSN